jgi:hypothetical protein
MTLVGLVFLLVEVPSRLAVGQSFGTDERHEQSLFAGSVQIPSGKQFRSSFNTKSNYRNCRIAGNVGANGGTGNDIRVMIEKENSIVYDSSRRRAVVLSVDCSEAGQYVRSFSTTVFHSSLLK